MHILGAVASARNGNSRTVARVILAVSRGLALSLVLGCQPDPTTDTTGTSVGPKVPPNSAGKAGTASTASRPSSIPPAGGVVPQFREVAADRGVAVQYYTDMLPGRYFLPEIMCGGMAWFDYDLDGLFDLYVTDGARLKDPDPADFSHHHRLFQQSGEGRFVDVTFLAGLGHNGYGQGTAVGDFNADGFPDLFVSCYGPNVLYVNNGDGTFTLATSLLPQQPPQWSTAPLWADFNSDGNLDLYVANYMDVNWETHKTCNFGGKPGYCGPGEYEAQADWLFISDGAGGFREAAAEFGMVGERGNGLALAWADFDGDRRPELYVANDMAPNYLFSRTGTASEDEARANGVVRYADVAPQAGCAVSGHGQNEASMGIALADFDGDELLDIYLTHYYHHKNTLYHNLGGMLFEDDSYRTRVAAHSHERLGFGTVAFDYDRDGAPDLFVANGHVLGPESDPFEMPPTLLHNDGRGRFDDVSLQAGDYFQKPCLGRGVAGADFDNDGDLDLAITHLDRPVALLENVTETGRSWVGVVLQTPNRVPPVGGLVTMRAGDRVLRRHVWVGGTYLSANDDRLLFGVPPDHKSVTIEVEWPDGRNDRFENLAVNRYWIVRPGSFLATEPPQ